MKTILPFFAVFVLSLSLSCVPSKDSRQDSYYESETDLYNPPGVMPIVKRPVTLEVFAPSQDRFPWEDNLQTKELEELTGIKLKWKVASISVRDAVGIMFAGGEIADMVFMGPNIAGRLNKIDETLYAAQGHIIPLNKYFDTVSVGYRAAFDETPDMREFLTMPDNNIYNLPNVDGSLHIQYPQKLWINVQWLNNLGLAMPSTTEEFYQALKEFKEQDANGNGDPNDEIPLSTIKHGTGAQIDGFLMNPFQLTPDITRLYVDNGKIIFSPVTENYREGLAYLHRLYAEGLITPESFLQDIRNQVNRNESGSHAVIGAFLGLRPDYACDLNVMPNSKRWEQYRPLPPLRKPGGKAVAAWEPYIKYQTGMTFITSSCKYPEAAFRLIDYLATREGSLRSRFGVKGLHWTDAVEGETGLDGKQAEVKIISPVTSGESWGQLAGLVRPQRLIEFVVTNPNPYAQDVHPLDGRLIVLYHGTLDQERVRQPLESVLPDLYYPREIADELSLVRAAVMDYTETAIIRFITGDMSIDRDWESYKQSLANAGLDRYLSLLQTAYDLH